MATSWERAIARVRGEKTGTGFVVHRDQRLLLTSAHVVGAAARLEVRFPGNGAVLRAEVVQNWAPHLDAALLQVGEALPEGVEEAWLGLDIVTGHGFRSLGYHYAGEGAPIPVEGQIRGLGELGGQLAIFLSSIEVAEGMSGAPLGDAETGLVVGLVRRFHQEARWLACGVPLSAVAERWPRLRELTAEGRYRGLLQTTYGFWERRFTPLEMTAQEREQLPEDRRGWVPPCFTVLEERDAGGRAEGEPPAVRRVPLQGGLVEALEGDGGVVLVGEPGAGKTTALQHLAGQLAPHSVRIPVLVTLRRYERGEEVMAFLRSTWVLALREDLEEAIKCGETEPVPPDLVQETVTPLAALLDHWLEGGRLLFLLDGLNEMPGLAAEDLRVSHLAAFVDRARARGNQVVVACRVLDHDALRRPLERPLQQVALEPLDEERIRIFLCGYLGKEEGGELADWLGGRERRALHELCGVPFFLRLVAYLYQRDKEPPSRRVDLLNEYVKVAVKREQQRLEQDWEPDLLVRPLSELALAMQEQGTLEVWQSEARPQLKAFRLGGAGAALRIAEGAGLLRVVLTTDLRGNRVSFAHQLWHQDMAARALVRRSSSDDATLWRALRPHVLDDRWAEVVVLASARLQDATRLVEDLLKANRNDFRRQRPLFLAAAALVEGACVSGDKEREVADLLNLVVLFGASGNQREKAIKWLGRLRRAEDLLTLAQDEQVVAWVRWQAARVLGGLGRAKAAAAVVVSLTQGEQPDPSVRWQAARVLEELGRAGEGVPTLQALARDTQAAAWVRWQAAEALARLGRAEDAAAIWLALARDEQVDAWVRWRAAEALGVLGRVEEAAAMWVVLVQDEQADASVSWQTLDVLTEVGWAEEGAPILLVLARSEQLDAWVRWRAAEALGRFGRANDLLTLARDEQVAASVRVGAAWHLGKLGQAEEAAAMLLALARDEQGNPGVRERAAEALADLGLAEEAAAILLALARDEQVHAGVRERAADALGRLGRAEEAAPIWLALARDEQVDARMGERAVAALEELGLAEEAAAMLLALARDTGVAAWVRWRAADGLARLGRAEEAAAIWLALARDEQGDPGVRERAAEALADLGLAEEAAAMLLALARDTEVAASARVQAAGALGKLGRANDLLTLARDEQVTAWVRRRAAEALGRLGRAGDLMTLVQEQQLDASVRWQAFWHLRELGRAEELLALARDAQVAASVRVGAAWHLGKLGQAEEAAAMLLALARDEQGNPGVRERAAEALADLGLAEEAAAILLALARDEQVHARVRERAAKALGGMGRAEDLLTLARSVKADPIDRAVAVGELDSMRFPVPEPLRRHLALELGEATWARHWREWLWRLAVCVVAWLVFAGMSWWLSGSVLLPRLAFLHNAPSGSPAWLVLGVSRWQVALGAGGALTLPLLLYQGLGFAWPALYRRERRQWAIRTGALLASLYIFNPLIVFVVTRTAFWEGLAIPSVWAIYGLHRASLLPAAAHLWFLSRKSLAWLLEEAERRIGRGAVTVRRAAALLVPCLFLFSPMWSLSLLMALLLVSSVVFSRFALQIGKRAAADPAGGTPRVQG